MLSRPTCAPHRIRASLWWNAVRAKSWRPTLRCVLSACGIRRQEILAELGVFCLQGRDFAKLLDRTAQLTAEALEADYCKVLEYIPSENRLLVRAGVGWQAGVVGKASVGADLASPAGFALRTGKPVISNDLENEESASGRPNS